MCAYKVFDTEMQSNSAAILKKVYIYITWIDFPVVPDAIGVNDVLEARGELVGLVKSRWSLLRLHPIEDGRHRGAAPLLGKNKNLLVKHMTDRTLINAV